MNNDYKKYKVILIVLVLIVVSFCLGIYVEKTKQNTSSINPIVITSSSTVATGASMDPFWQTWNILDQKFVYTHKNAKKITDQDKVWGAIQGLTAAYGDPYTVFMPPAESKNFDTDISGNFEGVGMELAVKDKNIVVVAPLKDTPAYNAGVLKGDIVLSIDGTSTASMSVDDAVNLIRGKAGTVVTIKFAREGKAQPIEIKMIRSVINVPTVDTEIKGDVFIIRLYNFFAPSADEFRTALRSFYESGKPKLILDLRGNPGGYLESAVDMASWFLPLGQPVVEENFGPNIDEQVYRSKGYDIFNSNFQMIILADSGSASASEILAGALQEHKVAKIVGTKTFGKGSVQELIKVTPDTSLKVTVARWLTPNGISISDGGLTPDYEVEMSADDVAKNKDPQMDKAISLLDSK